LRVLGMDRDDRAADLSGFRVPAYVIAGLELRRHVPASPNKRGTGITGLGREDRTPHRNRRASMSGIA
jgi:hypothetical protein